MLTARAHAVREYELHKEEGGSGARMRLFDAPRCSRGSRSCPPTGSAWRASSSWASPSQEPTAADGFELDLSTSDAHKTAAIFGPSTTPEPAAACALLRAWLAAAGLGGAAAAQPYVFVLGSCRCDDVDHAKPLGAPRWTELVQAVLKRQAGVPFAPKDLRSSFITFLC